MIFPAPHTRETVASYGYRIARLSGLSSLPEMAYLFDLDLRALLMGDRHSVERLARYTGCDPAALGNGALDASNPRRLQLGADPRNKVMCAKDRFRFCPACLGNLADGNLRSACLARTDWLIDANHVCAEHEIRLMTITPAKLRASSRICRPWSCS
ncbi:TniQ family protein [Paracoccus cavernae]|uniref:TniQ family protein n=1 Tax=Paracoccus cavernae TaxID=1571207 RepID=UPI00362940C9